MVKTTIIIPAHNSGDNIREAIESIISTTEVEFKMIVIDDGSTDETPEILKDYENHYENIKVITLEPREKPEEYDGRLIKVINIGIRESDPTTNIYITHDDTQHFKLYKADWLEMLERASEMEDCGLATSMGAIGISDDKYLDTMRWVGTWSMYIPRKILETVGLFDESFIVGDDIDYTFRVLLAGKKIKMCPFWVNHHRLTAHEYSKQEDPEKKKADYNRLVDKSSQRFKEKYAKLIDDGLWEKKETQ